MTIVAHAVLPVFFSFALAEGGNLAHSPDHTTTVFIAEILLMLLVGRLLGELMQRSGPVARRDTDWANGTRQPLARGASINLSEHSGTEKND